MPDDQFLAAHEVMEYVYNIAGVKYPVSIRDQMNRARWIVDKAYDLGFFAPARGKFNRLLVCGAGAAGVTAALHAISLGVSTVLVEKSGMPFGRQAGCQRWIDPTQYDWSVNHWEKGSFPHAGPPMPLDWTAAKSSTLALNWLVKLVAALPPRGPLDYRSLDNVVGLPAPVAGGGASGIQVTFATGGMEVFGMLLWCVGFGEERRHVPLKPPPLAGPANHVGYAFWEPDPYELPNWGVPPPVPGGLKALVSGGGDGALQDVIRLSTRQKSAKDVLDKITKAGWSIPPDVSHRLLAAEDQAQRALTWCREGTADEHRTLQELHDAYVREVDTLIPLPRRPMLVRAVQRIRRANPHPALVGAVRKILGANPHPVLFVHSCTHFNRVYGLNRFLVLLLAQVAKLLSLSCGPEIRQQRGVDSVIAGGCVGTPGGCHGLPHTMQLSQRLTCIVPPVPPGPAIPPLVVPPELAHVLVIRHGIAENPAFAATPLAFARQILPYHLPG